MDAICRICLGSTGLGPLFPIPSLHQSFARVLYLSTGLQINVDDDLPQNICEDCADIIEAAMRLRLQSQAAEKKLLQYLKTNRDKSDMPTNNIVLKEVDVTVEEEDIDIVASDNEFNVDYKEFDLNSSSPSSPDQLSSESEDWFTKCINTSPVEEATKSELEIENMCKSDKRNHCNICKIDFKTSHYFKKHIMWKHLNPKILCEFCGKICGNKYALQLHQRAKHGLARDNRYRCTLCDYHALYQEQLKAHERHAHTKERPFGCDKCGARFYTRPVLRQHELSSHTTERPFQCDICSSKHKVRRELTSHIHRIHTKRYKKTKTDRKKYRYGCYICPNRYDSNFGARQHIERVHRIPFKDQSKLLRFIREGFEESKKTD